MVSEGWGDQPDEQWEYQLREIEEQIYSYKECDEKGHFWADVPAQWFRYGWRWPWRTKVWSKKCGGCGWVEYNSRPRHWRRR